MTYFKDHDLRFGHPALGNYPPQGTCRGLFSDCPISACVFSFYLKKIKGLEVVHTAGCVACVRGSANGHTALVSRPRQCVKVPRCSPQLPPLPAFSVTHHLPRHTALQACRPQQWLDACSVLKPPQERKGMSCAAGPSGRAGCFRGDQTGVFTGHQLQACLGGMGGGCRPEGLLLHVPTLPSPLSLCGGSEPPSMPLGHQMPTADTQGAFASSWPQL